jgi:hypothetical protein
VFCIFYNWPLTIRRRMRKRSEVRARIEPRYWHIALCAVAAPGIFGLADVTFLRSSGALPQLRDIWVLALLVPLFCGAAVTLGAGGAALARRIIGAALCGALVGVLYGAMSLALGFGDSPGLFEMAGTCIWRGFLFSILSTIGAILTELKLPEP